jgi:hypothetical protein
MARLPRGRDRSGPRPGYNWLYTCVSHEMWVQRPLLSPDRGAAPRRCLGVPRRHGRDPRFGPPPPHPEVAISNGR